MSSIQSHFHLRPPSSVMPEQRSSSGSSLAHNPFEFMGCCNCPKDLLSSRASRSTNSSITSFWLLECGHLSCVQCLGFPDAGQLDPTADHQCPIPTCRGSLSAVYELDPEAPLHPAVRPFFESPRVLAERMEAAISFQSLQMAMRIKNLRQLVGSQQEVMSKAKPQLLALRTSKQEIAELKRQIRHLNHRIDQQKKLAEPVHQLRDQAPANLPAPAPAPAPPSVKPIKRRATADQMYLAQHSNLRSIPNHDQRSLLNNAHQVQPALQTSNRPNPAIGFASNPTRLIPRTSSTGTNSELSLANLRRFQFSPRHQPVAGPSHGNNYASSLMAIPENDEQAFESRQPVAPTSTSRHPQPAHHSSASIRSAKRPAEMPHHARPAKVMPLPIPPRLPPTSRPASARKPQQSAQHPQPVLQDRRSSAVRLKQSQPGFTYQEEHVQEPAYPAMETHRSSRLDHRPSTHLQPPFSDAHSNSARRPFKQPLLSHHAPRFGAARGEH